MAKLILSMEGSVIREIPLDKERLAIGRGAHNEIRIENVAVDGDHARIVTTPEGSFIEDLGSAQGTRVNGNPTTGKRGLQNGDVIEIGGCKLKYVAEAASAGEPGKGAAPGTRAMTAAAPVFGTMDVRARVGEAPTPPVSFPDTGPADSRPLGVIRVLSGPSAGTERELAKNLTTLGKPGVQVAVIARGPEGYAITHVEGATFPVVNGKALGAQAHPLRDQDVIDLGGVKMIFFFKVP